MFPPLVPRQDVSSAYNQCLAHATMRQINWLRLAQIVWLVLIALTLTLYVLGAIVYFRQLETSCTATRLECHDRELATPEDVASLQQDGMTLRDWAIANVAYRTLITSTFCVVAFLIFVRKRNEWNGLLISYFLIAFGTLGGHYMALTINYPALTLPVNTVAYLAYVSFAFFFATFPDGLVVPRMMWVPILLWSTSFFLSQFFGWPARTAPWFDAYAAGIWFGMFVSGMLAQVYRYMRVSNAEERRQTKWVVLGLSALVITILLVFLSPLGSQFGDVVVYSRLHLLLLIASNLLLLLIPISIGIAILRSRLFDIDILIRRTLSYVLMSALLVMVFFGSVIVLQRIFSSVTGAGQNELVTVLSTLAIAVLFVPVRHRVQSLIDMRFNRSKYDAQKVLAQFAAIARDETDLHKLTGQLIKVVQETMQPQGVRVWLRMADNGHKRTG